MDALAIYGTRPERIKLDSVIRELKQLGWRVAEFFTHQGPALLDSEAPPWRTLPIGISETLAKLEGGTMDPRVVLVVGDTASAFVGALHGFLRGVPVAHIEAGMRTYTEDPRPEEQFRGMIARIATYHFCPSHVEAENLYRELDIRREDQYRKGIFVVGNTVFDDMPLDFNVFVTMHRRENWYGAGEAYLEVVDRWLKTHSKATGVVVKHPNWEKWLPSPDFACLRPIKPLSRDETLRWIRSSAAVITDSGGLQEESAYLGTPCFVCRPHTERTKLIDVGAAVLTDNPRELTLQLDELWKRRTAYGSGDAGAKIADILTKECKDAS